MAIVVLRNWIEFLRPPSGLRQTPAVPAGSRVWAADAWCGRCVQGNLRLRAQRVRVKIRLHIY